MEPLDLCLQGMRRELDETFFEHLRWEVEQQVAAKNEKLLGILELVIQRACVEAEAGHPEVELLAALILSLTLTPTLILTLTPIHSNPNRNQVELLASLLQTRNREMRQEMYQRKLATAVEVVRRQFGASVQETQLRLEKDLLARMVETRRPDSGRACHLRLEAPCHLRTARPWALEQSYARVGPVVPL